MTIAEALMEVLRGTKGLTHKEAYAEILARNLYTFKAINPESVVNRTLRTHCEGLDFPSASSTKYFFIVGKRNGSNVFALTDDDGYRYKPKRKTSLEMSVPRHCNAKESEYLPEEEINQTYLFYKNKLKAQILENVMGCHPSFFEHLVMELLLKMGYGADDSSGWVSGKSRDGGIDGVFYEDMLGLSNIFFQAKKYDVSNTVGRPLLQSFVGAMEDVQKGVFITTSTFTKDAREYAEKQQQKSMKLIDGELLAELMIKYEIGLDLVQTYKVYKINEGFYE